MFRSSTIKIIEPKPYAEVDVRFVINGFVPNSWLDSGFGTDNRVYLDLIDIEGQTFMDTSVNVIPDTSWLSKYKQRSRFYSVFQFDQFNAHFIEKSQGRITLKLSGHKDGCQLFLPIIVKSSNPNFKPNPEIVSKHGNVGKTILQYERDLKDYNEALEKLEVKRLQKCGLSEEEENLYRYEQGWEISSGLSEILDRSENTSNEDYPFTEEDLEEKRLEEKYKDAIAWRGPLFTGIVGRMNGYEFRVYSHDHDQHFHVIHKEKRINARFSFPEIKLINYKNTRNSIGSKVRDEIVSYFQKQENFKKLEVEFQKRI